MSWKFGGIYIRKKKEIETAEIIEQLQLSIEEAKETVSFSEATSSDFFDTTIAEQEEIILIQNNFFAHDCSFEPDTYFEFDDLLLAASTDMDILCFFLDGITSTYGLSIFSENKRIRCRGLLSGSLIIDEGEYLPIEAKAIDLHEEDRILLILSDFTKLPIKKMLTYSSMEFKLYKDVEEEE